MANKPQINGIHHVAIKCNGIEEFEKTVHFYKDILGLAVVRTWGQGKDSAIMIDTGAGLFEIFANGDLCPTQGAYRHLALSVENTDDCIEAVRNAGYKITIEPKDICIPSEPPYHARIAFCIGPVGEEIEFFCVK